MASRASSTSWPHAHRHRAIMAAHVSCIRSSIYPLYVSSHLPRLSALPLASFSCSFFCSAGTQEGEMLLEASATVALLSASSEASNPPYRAALVAAGGHPLFSASIVSFRSLRRRAPVAAVVSDNALSGIVFQPFEEIKKDIYLVPTALDRSIARQKYADECEAAVNEQINVEYNNSYIYHALFAYFDRDNVALKGLAKFFEDSSEEEREHAEKLMEYQNKRGGKVKLQTIAAPLSEFDHPEKGDALYAMELALALEKLTNEKLLNLHTVADKSNDAQLADFIESEFLEEQVESVKKISEYVAQLRRVGKGHGVWHFDQMLLHEGGAA